MKEVSFQTLPPYSVSRVCQTNSMIIITTKEEGMNKYSIWYFYEPILQDYLSFSYTTNNPENEFLKKQPVQVNQASIQTQPRLNQTI